MSGFDQDYLQDLFQSTGTISVRKMFGGQGIYANGAIIAVVLSSGELFMKGDGETLDAYEARGMRRWTYENAKSGKQAAMPYWALPESAFDDPDEMEDLIRLALGASARSKSK